jgi:DNA-binding CsgD family transcriptional regulator
VGRGEELGALASFLQIGGGGAAVLAIEGEPGIGKTTIWREGVRLARERGATVLVAQTTESEAGFSFAGLTDLLDLLDDAVLQRLPAPQHDALSVALLRAKSMTGGVDERVLSTALLTLLRSLATETSIVVAVDDAQWLDSASSRVLSFAVRRLGVEPVRFLTTVRMVGLRPLPSFDRAVDPARRTRLALGPLSVAALHELIRLRSGESLPRPTMVRVAEACAGNPLYALEIAAGLSDHELLADGRLPVPPSLRELLDARVARLPRRTRDALVVAAMSARPTAETVDTDALEPAERAGVVIVDEGRIRFSHPLLGAALSDQVGGAERRRVHRQLADLVGDREERARHLALGSPKPDRLVADELDVAASLAAARGAPQAAAELMELAVALTPAGRQADLAARKATAGGYWTDAGDLSRAERLLEDAIASQPPGDAKARALGALAQVHFRRNTFSDALDAVRRARAQTVDWELQVRMDLDSAFFAVGLADFAGFGAYTRAAADAMPDDADPALVADVLAVVTITQVLSGHGLDEDRLARALELEDLASPAPWQMHPSFIAACIHLYTGRPAEAASILTTLHAYAVERGEESVIPLHCFYLTWALVARGDLQRAGEVAAIAEQTATLLGDPASEGAALTARALVGALDGSEALACEQAARGLQIFQELNWPSGTIFPTWVWGLAALTAGKPETVDTVLGPLAAMVAAIGDMEPGLAIFVPDQIEALIELGRLDEAESLLSWLDRKGRELDRALSLGAAGRCWALLHAARGDLDSALAAGEAAVAQHERIDVPFERGRSLLVWGRVLRRARRRAQADRALRMARDAFAAIGAPVWTERAGAELARLGGRRPGGVTLTPTESTVAALAASGLSNREIAERAFLRVKAVEANLTRVYRKLGIRSRGGLARALQAADAATR